MYGTRELLAVVLSIGFGLFLIAFPAAFVRLQMVGRGPRDRGQYGDDWSPPTKYTLPVRAIGLIAVGVGAYIAVRPL
ncbi:hypothetical protein [Halostella sp. PRR32]|uniref:hypothetical protein n=1 Tax=Halostella sp. PRR32 TaxID=3098147 RepID=UPI002B1DB8B2|nr:hypothetical protein [Halostella sp. PRR32]